MSVVGVIKRRMKPHLIKRASAEKSNEAPKLDGRGRPIRDTALTVDTVMLHWQPMGAKEVSRLPEGERSKENISVWTIDDSIQNSDRIAVKGYYYQLNNRVNWMDFSTFTGTKSGEVALEASE